MSTHQNKSQQNIRIIYCLEFLNSTFFWYAPWLLFLLNYIDFSDAALIQAIGLFTRLLFEIPTGALADLLGKKNTLLISFILTALAEIYISFANTMPMFIIGYILVNIGYSFYSGTMDAFTYDSLLEEQNEELYTKVLSRAKAAGNLGLGFGTIAGGFLYNYWIGLPFLLTGLFKIVGVFFVVFLHEPRYNTLHFSIKSFIEQFKIGTKALFNENLRSFTYLLVTFSVFHLAADEIIDDISVIKYGYSAEQIGILFAAAIFLSIPLGLVYERISKKIRPIYLVYIGILVFSLNYIFSLWISASVWTILFLIRSIYSPLRTNATTHVLNLGIASNVRATALSAFSMLKTFPFVFIASFIGHGVENVGLLRFNTYFFLILLVGVIPQILFLVKKDYLSMTAKSRN